MKARIVLMVVIVFLLTGCVSTRYITTDEVYTKTTSTYYPYKKTTWINGPPIRIPYTAAGYSDVFLRTLVADGKPQFHQLYIRFNGFEWVFFNRAYDINGNQLDFEEIDRMVESTGTVEEDFVITFERDYLESAAKTGINIKCIGKRGERVVTLEPTYVEGYLKKYSELISSQ